MSKVIAVIDKPSNCIQCPCIRINSFYDVCQLAKMSLPFDGKEIPDWCPLREVPQKKRTIGKERENDMLCLNAGWNACIDDILKGAEENG